MTFEPRPPSPPPPPERTRLRIGFVALSDCAPLVIAEAHGLDRRHGLEITLSRENSWAAIRDKLVSGELDAAHCLYGLVYGLELGIGGPRHPMHVLMGLSSNGQSITFSTRLRAAGISTGADLRAAVQAGGRRFTFAHTFPTGTHAMWLYYWLASLGIDPLRDVRMLTVPPSQMVARLGDGSIDGCCVGEPWGARAVDAQVGFTVLATQQLWPDHPEKVLASRAGFAREYPATARALIRVMIEACRTLDQPGERTRAAALIAGPDFVDCPLDSLLPRLIGAYDDGLGRQWQDPHAVSFFGEGRVTFPWTSDALWFLSQFERWGLVRAPLDHAGLTASVQQQDLYRAAASDLGLQEPMATVRAPRLEAEIPWTPDDPGAYARAFPIRSLEPGGRD